MMIRVIYITIGIMTVLKFSSLKIKGRFPSLRPIVNSELLILLKKSNRYLLLIAIVKGVEKPVLKLISVLASMLSSLSDSKSIKSFKKVIFTSVEIVVICFIDSIIIAFGKIKLFAISLGIILEYSGNFPLISFVKKVYWSEWMIKFVSS